MAGFGKTPALYHGGNDSQFKVVLGQAALGQKPLKKLSQNLQVLR